MNNNYEYKFVKIGQGFFVVKSEAEKNYQNVVREYANSGWRLIQIFSPSLGFWGLSRYFELIFEREKQ